MTQLQLAAEFANLHQAGNPLVLYNIWDAGSAAVVAKKGARALATGSASVAMAQGYTDGENIPLELLLGVAERICTAAAVPVSIDFESGFAKDTNSLSENVCRLIATGAVGINFEDQLIGQTRLYPVDEQIERIRTIRQAAFGAGAGLFINARTDLFLQHPEHAHAEYLERAIERGRSYTAAGADGFFVPGLADESLIETICQSVELPINVMLKPGVGSIARMAKLGVSRISFGPYPYFQLMDAFGSQLEQAVR